MKKRNILLSAIGLISVFCGVMAMKAQHRFNGNFVCYTNINKRVLIGNHYTLTSDPGAARLLCSPRFPPTAYITRTVTLNL